ncbi:MAG: MerR family transcriptional regulator [Dehalococcoidia bacterium]|nr:MerR family transcriptional regulator [Dehalococcoidia bacterium]MCL2615252.1 MerR family transcriptional regulator [Dehalococcoidia bacterium]
MHKNKPETNRPRYVISVAAEMLGTQPYTLRYYERVGIIKPARSGGNLRLYSDDDLMQLRRVMTLMYDLGVNLAGVEVIMRMSNQIIELQHANTILLQKLNQYRQE